MQLRSASASSGGSVVSPFHDDREILMGLVDAVAQMQVEIEDLKMLQVRVDAPDDSGHRDLAATDRMAKRVARQLKALRNKGVRCYPCKRKARPCKKDADCCDGLACFKNGLCGDASKLRRPRKKQRKKPMRRRRKKRKATGKRRAPRKERRKGPERESGKKDAKDTEAPQSDTEAPQSSETKAPKAA